MPFHYTTRDFLRQKMSTPGDTKEQLEEALKDLTENGRYISANALRHGLTTKRNWTDEQVDEVIRYVDVNSDGHIIIE